MKKSLAYSLMFLLWSLLASTANSRMALNTAPHQISVPISFPSHCMFYDDTGGDFPASDQGFFERLKNLQCPELSYVLPGYSSTNVSELRFLIYFDIPKGIGASSLGVCQKSEPTISVGEPKGSFKCYWPDPNWMTNVFDSTRRK